MKEMIFKGITVKVLRQGGKNARIVLDGQEILVPVSDLIQPTEPPKREFTNKEKKYWYAKKFGWHEVKFMQEMCEDDTVLFREVKNLIDDENRIMELERRYS